MAGDVSESAQRAGNSIADAAADGAQQAARSLNGIADDAARAGSAMGSGIEDGARRASRAAAGAADNIGDLGNAGRRAGEQAGDGIGDGGEQGGRRFSAAISAAAQAAQRALNSVADQSVLPERLGNLGRSAASKLGGALKAGLAGVGISVGAGLAATLGAGLDRLVTIDTARTKLKALGNDAQSVETIMKNANAAVKGTAYGMGDAATIAASAVAAGVKPGQELERYLRMTADAASIAGVELGDMGSIMNKVQTNGVAMTDDLQMLADRGIPIFTWLSKATGKTGKDLQKLVEDGGVSAKMFQDVIAQNIGGAAKTMGESVSGGFSNMKAAMGRFGAALIGPFFNQAGGVLSSVTTMFDNMTGGATAAMTRLNDWIMNTLVPGIQSGIAKFTEMGNSTGMFDRIGNIFTSLRDIGLELFPVIGRIVGSLSQASGAIGFSAFDILLRIIESLLPVLNLLVGALDWLSRLMADNQTAVTILVGAYTAWKTAILVARGAQAGLLITQGILTGLQGRAAITLAGHTAAITANTIASRVAASAQTAWGIAVGILSGAYFRQAGALIASTAQTVANRVATAAAAIATGVQTAATNLLNASVWRTVAAAAAATAGWIAQRAVMVAGAIATGIMAAAQWALNSALLANPITWIVILIVGLIAAIVLIATKTTWFQTAWQYAWNGIKAAAEWVWGALQVVWNGMVAAWNWVWGAINAGIGFIVGGWQWLWGVISSVIGWIRQKFNDFVAGVWIIWYATSDVVGKTVGKFMELMRYIGSIPGKVAGWFRDAGSWLYDAGKNIIQGLINGAGSLLPKIGNFFLDMIPGWIKGPFKKALGISSPSKLFASYGQNIGQGLIQGVQGMSGQVQSATQDLANSAADISMPTVTATVGAPAVDATAAAPVAGPVDTGATAAAGATAIGDGWQTAADSLTNIATGQIDPTMQGLQQGILDFGLNTQTQLSTIVDPAWASTALNLATQKLTLLDPAMLGIQNMTNVTAGVTANSVYGVMNPAWQNMGSNVAGVMWGTVNPVMAAMRGAVGNTAAAFGQGASNIATQWNRVREATASPVRFAISSVFNDGIVGMWNSVSDLLGTKKMGPYPVRFARGGVLPGYTPGRDVHNFWSPTAGGISLSGGEAIMRPEFTKAVGPENVDAINAAARIGGRRGVEQWLGFAGGGVVPAMTRIIRQKYPMIQLTSGQRNSADNHGRGLAGDFSNGTSPTPQMTSLANDIANTYPGSMELIYGPPFNRQIKNGRFVGGGGGVSGFYAGAGDHSNHVHWAMSVPPTIPFGGGVFPGGSEGFVDFGQIVKDAQRPHREKLERAMKAWKGGGFIGEYPAKVGGKLSSAMSTKIDKLVEKLSTFADPGGAGVQRWRPLVETLLKRYRLGLNNTDRTLRRMNQESGGNPRAINLWDSNAAAGIPSKGLMQVIDPTFAANRDPMLKNDIWDPMANVAASMRYAMRQYGSLAAAYDRAGGYDLGGIAAKSGWLQKPINVPERVLSPTQTKAFESWMDAGGFQGDTIVMADEGLSDLASRIMGEMRDQGFSNAADYTFSPDGRTTSGRTTVMVNQYVTAPDARTAADEIESRLLKLI